MNFKFVIFISIVVLRTSIWSTLENKNKLFSITYISFVYIFLLHNWCNRLHTYYACTFRVHRYFFSDKTVKSIILLTHSTPPFALQSKYCVIYDLSSSINKWRTLCRMILTFFKRSSAGFNTVVLFFHSARAQ